MLIPIERPLIDARNIRDAATQTVSAGFVATHNQRSVLLLTTDSTDRASGSPHIQAGVRPGQKLLRFRFGETTKGRVRNLPSKEVNSQTGLGKEAQVGFERENQRCSVAARC